ncbi:MAG: 1,4-alpha-glucan-branching protein, partial [Hymenobacter sp.]
MAPCAWPGQTPYVWSAATTNFQRPARTNLVVYELHLRDFIARHDYQTLTDTLAYIKRLGINAIELMPINEFEGNDSWGYNPSFYFAPDKYYGTKTALKQFIDAAHARGMAVILDMVLNHSCGQSPMVQLYFDSNTGKPAANSPWFNVDATHPFNVCYDFNHESQYTKYFAKNVMKYWLQEYHVDGYRFDLSKGFTQKVTTDVNAWGVYDQSRVNIWQDYYNTLVATSPTLYPILEHLGNNDEEVVLSNIGLMPWGNMSYNYQQADMGYSTGWDLSYGYYQNRGWSQPNLVTYMESHDEERTMYKNEAFGNASGSYSVKDVATGLARNEMAAALFFTQPGPRMVWQFGEVGYDKSIFTCTDGTVPQPYGTDNCKTGAKPILWNYYQDASRRHLYDVYRAMIALKKQPAFAAPTAYV